jgi:hypothetical protein
VSRSRIFIRLPPAVARQRAIQWVSGLTFLSTDSLAPVALWKAPTSPPPRGDGCSDVEASREMDVAARACSACGGHWWCGRWWYGRGCVSWLVEAAVPAVGSTEHVGWLDPVG